MKSLYFPSVSVYILLLLAQACKYVILMPLDANAPINGRFNKFIASVESQWDDEAVHGTKAITHGDENHKRVKRFLGGNSSQNSDVGIIYLDDGTRVFPHNPIVFQGSGKAHLTREQLIWERIYQILRKRNQGNIPASSPGVTRQDLLECTFALRSQSDSSFNSGSLPSKCADFLPIRSGGGFQHTHLNHTPLFPSVSHTHGASPVSRPGLNVAFPGFDSGFHSQSGHSHHSPNSPHSPVGFPNSNPGSNVFFPGFPSDPIGRIRNQNGHTHSSPNSPSVFLNGGLPHSHPGSNAFFPGFPTASSGHIHGQNGAIHQSSNNRKKFSPPRLVSSSQSSNNAPPIYVG